MGKLLTILIVLLAAVLVWGLIGGAQADDLTNECDVGFGDGHTFCWAWSKNALGELEDGLKTVGNAIQEGLEGLQKLN